MSEAWELTDKEIYDATPGYPVNRAVAHAAARKAWWSAITNLEQVYGKFSSGARFLRAEAGAAGLDPWPDPEPTGA